MSPKVDIWRQKPLTLAPRYPIAHSLSRVPRKNLLPNRTLRRVTPNLPPPLPTRATTLPDKNGQYGAASYCIANTVVQLPFVFLIALSGVTPVYFITGMNDDVIR